MSLRRSPRRTLAFLAANRANAQKSTGPRTAPGKERSAANALRTGKRASPAFWPRVLSHSQLAEFHALRHAIERAVSASGENQNVAGRNTRLHLVGETICRALPPHAAAGRTPADREAPDPRPAMLAQRHSRSGLEGDGDGVRPSRTSPPVRPEPDSDD